MLNQPTVMLAKASQQPQIESNQMAAKRYLLRLMQSLIKHKKDALDRYWYTKVAKSR
jgi:hypothetical protein